MRKGMMIVTAGGMIVLIAFLVARTYSKGRVTQPVAYSHKVHLENAGLHCTDCHIHAEDNVSATVPSLEVCQNCHSSEPVSKSPEELKVLKYVAEKKEIPWVRVYKVPDHVYFSHRRHVIKGKLECALCHGNMNEQSLPVSSQFLPVTMKNCIDCHKEHKVTNDCLACHR